VIFIAGKCYHTDEPGGRVEARLQEGTIAKVCVLASSSSGNCTFIGTDRTRILVDAGLSRKEIALRLASIGEALEGLDAVLITHEHSDHVSGLPVLARALRIPVYITRLAAGTLAWPAGFTPKLEIFQAGCGFAIGDLRIQSFTVPHDAIDPVGFCVDADGVRIGVVMDLGYIPESVKYHVRGARLLVLEANHDVEMLKVGPYPWAVKQRVMGRRGHLSNDVVSEFILEELDGGTRTLVLGHLSEHNNHPEIVRLVADQALRRRALATRLVVAEPRRLSEVFQC